MRSSHLYRRTAEVWKIWKKTDLADGQGGSHHGDSGVRPHQTSTSIATTFLCRSVLTATRREAVMRNREVTVGIALGQFQSPAFLPGKSNLGLIVFKKKNNIKTLI